MTRGDQFRQPAPPPLTSAEYTANYLEVLRLGDVDSPFRTPDQSEIALFWNDGPGTNTPPGHWQDIARSLAEAQGNSLLENARLLALVTIAQADAAIVSWDNKYHWDNWRPYTAIHEADTDGNPITDPDTTWASFITTPPFPSYTSGHSTFSGSSSRILAHFFGTDGIAFSAGSDGTPGVTRDYTSLSQAAEEAGQSRIYGGIHWQYDNQGGLASGRALADHVFFDFLRPTSAPGTCTPSATALCLTGDRFRVEATWATAAGTAGPANAEQLTDDSGRFWFFQENNTELVAKVHDACVPPFDRFWVFSAGLTDVEVTLTVTDTQTGTVRTYFNPQGTEFAPRLDTSAFATCP
jgi:membrane-associated phospholipid phosphatase